MSDIFVRYIVECPSDLDPKPPARAVIRQQKKASIISKTSASSILIPISDKNEGGIAGVFNANWNIAWVVINKY